MSRHLRATVRLANLAAWTMWCAATGRVSSQPNSLRRWAEGACRIIGVRIVVSGPQPPSGSLLVANHLGYLDILALAATLETTFVAKHEIAAWPLVGRLAARAGTIFIERQRPRDMPRVMTAMTERLSSGRTVTYFPEATSTDGRQVLPFKSGLLQTAVTLDRPVHAAAIRFAAANVCPSTTLCWHGDAAFGPHFWRVLGLPRTSVALTFVDRPLYRANRKHLARVAHDAVVEHRETCHVLRHRASATAGDARRQASTPASTGGPASALRWRCVFRSPSTRPPRAG